MSFKDKMQDRTKEIEAILQQFLPEEAGEYKIIMEAMNYNFLSGGKRIRPMLMAESFRLFGGKNQRILEPFMAALEMIHTYSLVHDDLPCMDNDDYRRGRLTTHKVYGEAMALLAGDSLLNYAYETAARAFTAIDGSESEMLILYQRVSEALQVLGKKAGIHGMIGGQVIDIESVAAAVDQNRLDLMYRLKTSALIEAAMMIGSILAGASKEEVSVMESIGTDIGLAFQIKDDILDVTSTMEVLGKPIHSDEKNVKTTYVSIMNLEKAEEAVTKISNRAVSAYETLPYRNEFLKELILTLVVREK